MLPTSSTSLVLNVGDTWHYHYSGPERESTEQIIRSDTCGSTSCVVDQETNPAWNDTTWIDREWNLSRESYIDHTTPFNYSYVFTPPLHLYHFPLQIGVPWWSNGTVQGWYTDQFGNHTQTFSLAIERIVVNQTTITVPAGTFDTYLVAQYIGPYTHPRVYRWFSTQAKTSVKWEQFDTLGNLFDSYMMTSYSLAPVIPVLHIAGLSPNPARPSQIVRLDFTATESTGDVAVTATWVDWGDNSMPDLIFSWTSASMCPANYCTLPIGGLILARGQDPSTIQAGPDCGTPAVGPSAPAGALGSIIVFRPYLAYPDFLVVHRVRQVVTLPGNMFAFRTQGDNFYTNPYCDAWPYQDGAVPSSQVVGVYQATLTPSGHGERYGTHSYPDRGSTASKTYTITVNATDENGSAAHTSTFETINRYSQQSPTPTPTSSPRPQTFPPISMFVIFGIAAAAIVAIGAGAGIWLATRTRRSNKVA